MSKKAIKSLLLVEDDPSTARVLREMFNEPGAHNPEVTHVGCMNEAEKHLAEHAVDIVLLDLGLPDAQGLEAVRRTHTAAPHVPLVVLTASDDESLAVQALQEGAQDYLIKGQVVPRGLLRALRYAVERKRTERALAAATNRLHHLVSENPAVIYAARLDGEPALAWISENVERLLGFTVEEALSPQWWSERLHPDERAKVLADLAAGIVDGRLIQEYRFRHRDGTYLWLRDERRVLRDVAGQPTEVVGSLSDVSVRKRAERRLLESEEEYRLLFDSNPHPMWVFDVETLAFLAVNDAAVRLYGFSRDEFLGMTIKEIRPLEEVPALLEYLPTIPDSPSVPATQIKHRKKDGSLLEVAGVSNPIEFHGKRARLVMANDITEKKGLEAQLLQAQKMEAVGRLAGGVAHDFNNLLGVITGYSELLLKDLGPEHPGSKRVEQIQKAAERATGLTRQLLAFSRKQVLQPRVLDLNAVVAEVEKILRRVIREDIQLVTKPGAGLGRIRADPGQIEQVLMNLVVNARDAMPRGGGLILETANVALDDTYVRAHPEVQPGPFVMLSVSDTGEGMDAETQAHIFEPFFTTKEAGKGTGLGLATVFGIVQQSSGSVSVDSRPGTGSTFKIYFPRVEDDLSRPSPDPPGAPPPGGSETVLLVEDADPLRVMIREMLESAGFTVVECSDPEEALLRVRSLDAPVRLMLTDVVMPGMSGPDLAKSVRIARPEIKVLFMSGYTAEAMGVHGVLDAGTRFIQKPFTADALLRKVREALDEP
jgi:two-component system, cell cycle sensor histidine kinase and response regulator CckA